MRVFQIFLILILSMGCRPSLNFDDDASLCSELSEMLELDQKYRKANAASIKAYYPQILDSLSKVYGTNNLTDSTIPGRYIDDVPRIARQLAKKGEVPNLMNSDSIRRLQSKIDARNTRSLIRMVNKKGWIDNKNLECVNRLRTWIIFRHSPKKYWHRIRPLIEHERNLGRLGGLEYKLIDNHIKGRPPLQFQERNAF